MIVRKVAVVVPKYGLVGGGERFASLDRIKFHKAPMIRFPRFLSPWSFAWFASRLISRQNFGQAIIAVEKRTIKAGGSNSFLPAPFIAIEVICREYATLPGRS